jgi:DNA uptake protein ComE-like DNA-binding protein
MMFFSRLSVRTAIVTLFLAVLTVSHFATAQAGVSPSGNPISAEAQYSDDLSQNITLQPKININRASVHQLQLLPGFDSDIALKVIRTRPFVDMNDFYQKMPNACQKRLGYMRSRLQYVVSFR